MVRWLDGEMVGGEMVRWLVVRGPGPRCWWEDERSQTETITASLARHRPPTHNPQPILNLRLTWRQSQHPTSGRQAWNSHLSTSHLQKKNKKRLKNIVFRCKTSLELSVSQSVTNIVWRPHWSCCFLIGCSFHHAYQPIHIDYYSWY